MWSHLIILFLFNLSIIKGEDPTCVMSDQCVVDNTTHLNVPCVYSGPPKKLSDPAALNILFNLCPDIIVGKGDLTCCVAKQVYDLSKSIEQLGTLFKRCPSCYQNLANVFCHLTCSPEQSQFLEVTKSKKNDKGKDYVTEMSYYIAEDYAQGLFSSCDNVRLSYTSMKAVIVSCGGYGSDCNGHNWLNYMGTYGLSPFQINFQFVYNTTVNETTFVPMNDTIYPCNTSPKKGSTSCSCVDCPCEPNPLPPPESEFMIGDWHGMWVIMTIIYIMLALGGTFGFVLIILLRRRDDDCALLLSGEEDSMNKNNVASSRWQVIGSNIDEALQQFFSNWGRVCATYPLSVLAVVLVFILISSCGFIFFFTVRTNPVELWAAEGSQVRQEKNYFDNHFGPFYRTEQLIITRNNGTPVHGNNLTFSDVFDRDFLHEILKLQNHITSLTAERNNKTIHFEDICFAPVNKGKCMIQSPVNWFQNNATNLDYYQNIDDYLEFLQNCTLNPLFIQKVGLSCLGEYGGPIFPYVALGGVQSGEYYNATALLITLMVQNYVTDAENADAMAWETVYLNFIRNFSHPDMSISYTSERSIQDELNRESQSDVKTIIISYMVMFIYVSITLGQYHSPGHLFVSSKLLLGLGGVLIVMASVVSSIGIFSYFGVPSTLIIIEVIPFLVLAVGVDNIFIMVQTYYRNPRHELESREEHIGRVIGTIAPTLLLSSLSESTCFFLGALSDMPAVHVFALFSGMALLIDFVLQMTCFLALMSLDLRREEAHRLEVCCCVKAMPSDDERPKSHGFLYNVFEKYYAPLLMKDYVRTFVLLIFGGWLCSSIAVVSQVEVGLDQKLSMPEDSYVLKYFNSMEEYLSVGPPVYFVVPSGFNYSNAQDQNLLCSGQYCIRESLSIQLSDAASYANRTYIAYAPLNWLDNYISWTLDQTSCCLVYSDSEFCPPTEEDRSKCQGCNVTDTVMFRPYPELFYKYFENFIEENPDPDCPVAGHAAFASAVEMYNVTNTTIKLGASNFMTYHTILKTSEDYIKALQSARDIADNITRTFKLYNITDESIQVFPYSIFYVFYEQYLTIWKDTIINIVISLVDIFIVTLLFLGLDFHSSLIIVLTILSITFNLMGLMYWWNISLNAVSLVNLVMSVGISVEFCSHITRAFSLRSHGTKVQRAQHALAHMGSSVLSGITLTKFGGIVVLAFSKSQIFRVFYFRMYLGIVIIGASHGLILLPVLLSIIGPPVKKVKKRSEFEVNVEKMTDSATTLSDSQNYHTYHHTISH